MMMMNHDPDCKYICVYHFFARIWSGWIGGLFGVCGVKMCRMPVRWCRIIFGLNVTEIVG